MTRNDWKEWDNSREDWKETNEGSSWGNEEKDEGTKQTKYWGKTEENNGKSWESGYYEKTENQWAETEETEVKKGWGYQQQEGDWNETGETNGEQGWDAEGEREVVAKIDWEVVLPSLPQFDKDFYIPHPDVENRTEEEITEIFTSNKIQIIPRDHVEKTLESEQTEERPIPKPVTNMIEASFPEYITAKLCEQLGGPFTQPTAVQKLLWPTALSGRDCVAIAPTGTGKTLGYLLPAIVHISAQDPVTASDRSPIVLVVAPTRELAQQIMEQASLYGSAITDLGAQALKPLCVFGGVRKNDQKYEFERICPDLVVATPGRLMDFLRDGTMNLRRVTYFVIDEVDRLITPDGKSRLFYNQFVDDMVFVSSLIRPDRQCIMCSATATLDVLALAKKLCGNEPVYFQIGEVDQMERLVVSSNVQQQFAEAGDSLWHRTQFLLTDVLPGTFTGSLSRAEQKMMIFCNSKRAVDEVTRNLRDAGWPAVGVHSGKVQEEREWIFSNFKSGASNILVATDVMGRGMDFEDVRCVVNFDLPESIESYIHRVGRTGRIGKKVKKGYALSFLTTKDSVILPGLERMLGDSGLEVPELLKTRIEAAKASHAEW